MTPITQVASKAPIHPTAIADVIEEIEGSPALPSQELLSEIEEEKEIDYREIFSHEDENTPHNLSLRLLLLLAQTVPLLLKLKRDQGAIKSEKMRELDELLQSRVGTNTLMGVIQFCGGGAALLGAVMGGQRFGEVLSNIISNGTRSVTTLIESGKIKADSAYQLIMQLEVPEIKELSQLAQHLLNKLEEASQYNQSLPYRG
jgi:hypothetical protein